MDKQTEMMLEVANTLTAEDLESMRAESFARPGRRSLVNVEDRAPTKQPSSDTQVVSATAVAEHTSVQTVQPPARPTRTSPAPITSGKHRGEYERRRTRESKVSTACVGREREKHDWWPVGTELVGGIGPESFTARVVENRQVKSGRSILITSGPASGKACISPTGAAIEATEDYRQANNLGRAGGVTNGWEFWKATT